MKNKKEHFKTSKMKNEKIGTKILSKKQRPGGGGWGWGGHIVFSKKQKKKKLKMQNEMPRNKKTQ